MTPALIPFIYIHRISFSRSCLKLLSDLVQTAARISEPPDLWLYYNVFFPNVKRFIQKENGVVQAENRKNFMHFA